VSASPVLLATQEIKHLEHEYMRCIDRFMISGAAFNHDCYVKRDDVCPAECTGCDEIREQMESRKDRPGIKLIASMRMSFGASSTRA
jgi:hypothetical protein